MGVVSREGICPVLEEGEFIRSARRNTPRTGNGTSKTQSTGDDGRDEGKGKKGMCLGRSTEQAGEEQELEGDSKLPSVLWAGR